MMDNPYQPPREIVSGDSNVRDRVKISLGEIAFLIALTFVSFMTHWRPNELHDLFLFGIPTVSGIIVEAILLATWGCTLVAFRNRTASTNRFLKSLGGIGVAALVALFCCWILFYNGRPPHGLMLPISVFTGMAATTYMLRATNERTTQVT